MTRIYDGLRNDYSGDYSDNNNNNNKVMGLGVGWGLFWQRTMVLRGEGGKNYYTKKEVLDIGASFKEDID